MDSYSGRPPPTPLRDAPRETAVSQNAHSPHRRHDSVPFADFSNYGNSSPVRARVNSINSNSSLAGSVRGSPSARAISSSIVSSKDRPLSYVGSSSDHPQPFGSLSPGKERMASATFGRSQGHRRAMTLPQFDVDAAGRSSPTQESLEPPPTEEYVPGLPGRTRLSRPAESASPYAPSAVFHSSHGGAGSNSPKSGGRGPPRSQTMLLPSQAVKAIDRQRHDLVAYEYLCHLAEARSWLEAHITTRADPSIPLWGDSINDFEKTLRNGYALAHLARSLGGPACQGPIYNDPVRHFRHTVNINIFFQLLNEAGLPEIFRFETVDLYDGKNIPKVIYCVHALSHLLARRGLTAEINDLVGQIDFTDAEVGAAQKGLDEAGVRMPNFRGIGKALDKHEGTTPTQSDAARKEQGRAQTSARVAAFQAQARGSLARIHLRERRQRRREAIEAERRRVQEEEARQRATEEQERAAQAAAAAAAAVDEAGRVLVGFQACARGQLARHRFLDCVEALDAQQLSITALQAAARGHLARLRLTDTIYGLDGQQAGISTFQAMCRGQLARQRAEDKTHRLQNATSSVRGLQAQIRGALARRSHQTKTRYLRKTDTVRTVGGLQSIARAALARRQVQSQRQALDFVKPDVVGIQAHLRMWLARSSFAAWQRHLHGHEGHLVYLQSLLRGSLVRTRHRTLGNKLARKAGAFVQLQAVLRSRRQQARYEELRVGTDVSVDTIKSFMHLLDDSHHDYLGDLQVEAMRKEVISCIREMHELEEDVKDLDIKIALLVRNKITHEVARAQRAKNGGRHTLKRGAGTTTNGEDPFAGDVLDHHTRRKLELYQRLFWHLQTQPGYLARLFSILPRLSLRPEAQRQLEATAFVIFGYAQGSREEYLWLKFLREAADEELRHAPDLPSFAGGNFAFLRVLAHYGRGPALRDYLDRSLAQPIKAIAAQVEVDLDTDPVAIHQQELAREEAKTGVPSKRARQVDYAHALADQATNAVFIQHLISLRKATNAFLRAIFESADLVPYGTRYLARELLRALRARFPTVPERECFRVVGNIIYYRFLQPAILAPESYGIVDNVIPPTQRQNLSQICKLLNQISVGRLFGPDQRYLIPMNEFIESSSQEFVRWIAALIDIEDAQAHYGIDDHHEAASGRVPVIYISPVDIYSLHCVLADQLHAIAPLEGDPVRAIISELGSVPEDSSEAGRGQNNEVTLSLVTATPPEEERETSSKKLLEQTKRRVLAILKVHSGPDLETVLAREVGEDDEEEWAYVVDLMAEQASAQQSQNRPVAMHMDDVYDMSFHQVKMATLSGILRLRQLGLVSKSDKYQSILNGIAQDIRNKHQRRLRRQNELSTLHTTLVSLREKKQYYTEQIESYHLYIDQSMAGIQKKSKRRMVLPWSLQGAHERQLEREGKSYRFGSYKYSAQTLYDRGILLSVDQYSPKQFDKVTMTISSDDVGEFEFNLAHGNSHMPPVKLRLDDILEAQFVGRQTISLGETARCNLNLLLDLINRKFYA